MKATTDVDRMDDSSSLPTGWTWANVDQLAAAIQYGYTSSARERRDGPRFLRITDIQEGKVDWEAVPSCDIPQGKFEKYRLALGDLLFARTGATTGKSYLVKDCPEAAFASYLIRLRLTSSVMPEYVFTFFQSSAYWKQIEEGKRGIGQPNVNARILGRILIPLPPVSEQRRIVEEIEKQFTRLDSGVAALTAVQSRLKTYRASLLKAACGGDLVPGEAELARAESRGYEPASLLLERILADRRAEWEVRQRAKPRLVGKKPEHETSKKAYKEPSPSDGADLPTLPEGWCWATWGQISNWVTYGFTRPVPHVNGGIPIVTAKNVIGGKIDFPGTDKTTLTVFRELSDKDKPLKGDILVTKDGTIGRAAVVETEDPFCINQSVAVVWLRSCPLDRNYLLAIVEAPFTQKRILAKARGVAIQHLSITDFARMPLPIPPLAEQRHIASELERRLSMIDKVEDIVASNLRRAERLRRSVLECAFKGKLVPQDPNDEPASLILERIGKGQLNRAC